MENANDQEPEPEEDWKCHECGSPMQRDVRDITFGYRGHSETVPMPGWWCTACTESVHTGIDMMVSDEALLRMKAAVAEEEAEGARRV